MITIEALDPRLPEGTEWSLPTTQQLLWIKERTATFQNVRNQMAKRCCQCPPHQKELNATVEERSSQLLALEELLTLKISFLLCDLRNLRNVGDVLTALARNIVLRGRTS